MSPPELGLPALAARILLLAALAAAVAASVAQVRNVPNRPMRVRIRSSDDKGAAQGRPPFSASSDSTRRAPGYLLGSRVRSRKLNPTPLKPDDASPEIKHVASESVYMVSMNHQGRSLPVARAALTKRKITEPLEEDVEEPEDVSVRVVSPVSVLVSWVDPVLEKTKKVDSARRYSVRYREKGESARWDYKQVINRRALVDQLMPDTMYEFSARISHGDSHSQWSSSIFQRTPESAPTGAPESFDVWPLDSKGTAVSATWEPPSESVGKVKEYIISYSPALKPFGGQSVTVPGDATSTTIMGLQPGERYVFKIRAANRRGQGPPSKAFSVAMPGASYAGSQNSKLQDTLDPINPSTTTPASVARTTSPSYGDSAKISKNSASKLKNAFPPDDVINKHKLPLKKSAQIEPDFQIPEINEDNSSAEMTTSVPKTLPAPHRRNGRPFFNNRPGRIPGRVRPSTISRNANYDRKGSSSSISSTLTPSTQPPLLHKGVNKKTMDQRKYYTYTSSPSTDTLNNVESEDKENDSVESDDEKFIIPELHSPKHSLSSKVLPKSPRLPAVSNHPVGETNKSGKQRTSIRVNQKVNGQLHSDSLALVPLKPASSSKSHNTSSSTDVSKTTKHDSRTLSHSPALSVPVRGKTNPESSTSEYDPYSVKEATSIEEKTSVYSTVQPSRIVTNRKYDPSVQGKRASKVAISPNLQTRHETKAHISSSSNKFAVSSSHSSVSDNIDGVRKQINRTKMSGSLNPRQRLLIPSPSPMGSSLPMKTKHFPNHIDLSKSSTPRPSPSHKSVAHLQDISSPTTNSLQKDSQKSKKKETKGLDITVKASPAPPTATSKYFNKIRTTMSSSIGKRHEKNAVENALSDKKKPLLSFAGKSASEILEYYRIRSSLVNRTAGRLITLNPRRKTQPSSSSSSELPSKDNFPTPSPKALHFDAKGNHASNTEDLSNKLGVTSDQYPKTALIPSFSNTLSPVLTPKHSTLSPSSSGKRNTHSQVPDTKKSKDMPAKKVNAPGNAKSSLNIRPSSNIAKKMPPGKFSKLNPTSASPSKHPTSRVHFPFYQPTQASIESNFGPKSTDSEDSDEEDRKQNKVNRAAPKMPKHKSYTSAPSTKTSLNLRPTPSDVKYPAFNSQNVNIKDSRKKESVLPSLEASQSPVISRQNVPRVKQPQPDVKSPSDTGKSGKPAADESLSLKVPSQPIRRSSLTPNYRPGSRIPIRTGGTQGFRKFPQSRVSSSKYPRMSLTASEKSSSNEDEDEEENAGNKGHEEINENPTSSSRTRKRFSSVSVRHRNRISSIDNVNAKPRGSLLTKELASVEGEDEEELSAPPIENESLLPQSALLSKSTDSRKSELPGKRNNSLKTVASTTILPRSSTRTVSPYLKHSMSRQSYGERTFKPNSSTSPPITVSHTSSTTHSPSTTASSLRHRMQGSRLRSPFNQQFKRPLHRQVNGNNGRPNLTTKDMPNVQQLPNINGKPNGQRIINGPQGTKWIIDLNRGLVLNHEGRYLQDSQGKPLRIKLGGDGRTIVDLQGAPMVSPDGLPFFGSGRFSKPMASGPDKPILSLGGKPLIGLEVIRTTKLPTKPPTTTTTSTTTTTTTTTTAATTPAPTTVEPTTEELLIPTCPPGMYGQYDEEGNLLMGPDDLPECYSEESYSGLEMEAMVTTDPPEIVTYMDIDQDYELFETTFPPNVELLTTTPSMMEVTPEATPFKSPSLSNLDITGKERFQAPYVTYMSKDPEAPCSLTEALEHFQVESLDELIPSGLTDNQLPPQNITYNITVVAVEGCHSFIILDWLKPAKGDFVTGYLVFSASYDDYIRNKWATRPTGTTNLPIENLKPNTRYYFKVQAKNPYGYAPASPSVTFVTESDNPLLIVRPPGGEPIWIPFAFKYDPSYAECYGKQYVKRTWYRKFVGVVLCNSLRYKIYLSDNLRDTFYSIGDSWGRGEDHCQFVDSYMDGRTGPQYYTEALPPINGYHRQYRQEPVMFGRIGYGTPYHCVGWYECGVPIPGKW